MRWRQFGPQVNRLFDGKPPLRGHRLAGLGLGLCLLGLTKKAVLADSLAPFVDTIFYDGPTDAGAAWLGAWLFAFQIYFDFSGYSDMALGLGLIFGIMLARNFDTPFCATDIQQLWQRWHITLTALLRDYLFLPLSNVRLLGRRFRVAQHFGAMVLTMALCGLWHGAGWNFIVWGTLQGLAIVFTTAWARNVPSPPVVLSWAATFGFFLVSLVFFRAADFSSALRYAGTYIEALQVEWPDTAVGVAERILAHNIPGVEVVNLGLSGARPAIEVARLHSQGLALTPNVAIIVLLVDQFLAPGTSDDSEFTHFQSWLAGSGPRHRSRQHTARDRPRRFLRLSPRRRWRVPLVVWISRQ